MRRLAIRQPCGPLVEAKTYEISPSTFFPSRKGVEDVPQSRDRDILLSGDNEGL